MPQASISSDLIPKQISEVVTFGQLAEPPSGYIFLEVLASLKGLSIPQMS